MTLQEIRTLRQTCRAKVEDLLGRTSSRELSTEETQMLSDLKAEGERLGSLESRYAVLESFDKGTTQPIIHRPIAPTDTDRKAATIKALDGFLRTGVMATDTPLQIQQSPISGAAAAIPTDVVPSIIQGINDLTSPDASVFWTSRGTIPNRWLSRCRPLLRLRPRSLKVRHRLTARLRLTQP